MSKAHKGYVVIHLVNGLIDGFYRAHIDVKHHIGQEAHHNDGPKQLPNQVHHCLSPFFS
jgi:hypothetical protein